LPPLDITPY
nr:Chain C, PEPTIDE LPPLDITPY [unidentified]1A9B_F Chain F, PEPTIDE LPPLDITPY [unidentified]1A9E_C Chain C, PEPTIDE LPPLDITPY [unidentified]1CG9_C Chain C, PROTEIN (EBNA-6 NUCLEAR PROTEIN (EBNA-3C) (EBNA-4B)) [synthetic construct]